MGAQGRIKVLLVNDLKPPRSHVLPGPDPEVGGNNADRRGRSCNKDIGAHGPGSFEDIYRSIPIHTADTVVKQRAALLGSDSSGGVEHSHGLVGDGCRPWPREGCFDRRARCDVGLHEVATSCGLKHIPPIYRRKVDDADAFRGLAALEQLQDDVTTHEPCMISASREAVTVH